MQKKSNTTTTTTTTTNNNNNNNNNNNDNDNNNNRNYTWCIFIKVIYCNFTFILPLNVVLSINIFYSVLSWSISLDC